MTNLDYDIETRILTGEIVWPTTYFQSKTWEYEIEFDLCFEKIINGSIDKYNDKGELFDCYPLCDPALSDQDFKLKIETTEQSLLTKRKFSRSDFKILSLDKTSSTLFKLVFLFHQNLNIDLPFRQTSSRDRTSKLFQNLTKIFNQNHTKMIKDKNCEDLDDGYHSSNGDLELN